MTGRADRISLLFTSDQVARLPEGFHSALARHLIGQVARSGEHLHLPGWPRVLVDMAEPEGSTIGPGTTVEIHAPPATPEGPLSLAVVVDASLTMGKGRPESRYEHAARLIDAVLLSGRGFLARAGIVVQGGTTRHIEALQAPDGLSGASIHRATPKGTFDLGQGIDRAVSLLAGAPEGPQAILVVTDGSDAPKQALQVARPAMHAGVAIIALADQETDRLEAICRQTGGLATTSPERAFRTLASLAGTEAAWHPPPEPSQAQPERDEPYEFEVVIEAIDA